jgi:hypothetical protein
VSCLSPTSCFAVGQYVSAFEEFGFPAEELTVAESWNGTNWTLQSSPSSPEEKLGGLVSVSCTSSIACMAGGTAHEANPEGTSLTLGERYE